MGNAGSIWVKTSAGTTWHVDLGPHSYIERQETQIRLRDVVSVTGSKVTIGNDQVVFAERVVRGKSVLALRSAAGQPNWNFAAVPAIVNGTVTNVAPYYSATNGPVDVLTIKTDQGTYQVAVAPDWYAERQREFAQSEVGRFVNLDSAQGGGIIYPYWPGGPTPPITFVPGGYPGQGWTVSRGPLQIPVTALHHW